MNLAPFRTTLLISTLGFISACASGRAPASAPAGPVALSAPLPLQLRYPVGTTLRYRLVRHNVNFRMNGTKAGEQRMESYFVRTRLADDARGRVQESLAWKKFLFGQGQTAEPAKLAPFKAAEGFVLPFSVNDAAAIEKFDFSSLPRTFEGFMFMILTWDAMTFDASVRPSETLLAPDRARIGTSIVSTEGPRDFLFEYPPLAKGKYLYSGNSWVKVTGVSVVQDVPCAVIEFGQAENRIEMDFRFGPLAVQIRGLEHFWGKTLIALDDGRVVRGELVGPLTVVQETRAAGREEPDRRELFTVGYLWMDLLDESAFQSELERVEAPGPAQRDEERSGRSVQTRTSAGRSGLAPIRIPAPDGTGTTTGSDE